MILPTVGELVLQLGRKWAAIGVALVLPWIWLTALDRMLRRKR